MKIQQSSWASDGDTQEGHQYRPWVLRETLLAMHFITQATPDIQRKWQKLEAGPKPHYKGL